MGRRFKLAVIALATGLLGAYSPPAVASHPVFARASGISPPASASAGSPASVGRMWVPRQNLPLGSQHAGGAVLHGRFYVIGGEVRDSPLRLVQAFDAATGRWSARARLPQARTSVAAVAADRRLFAIAGRSSDLLPTRTLFRYNPASNRWGVRRSMPESLSGVAAAAGMLAGVETIFVFGGTNGSGVAEGSTYAYDVDTNRWSTKASMPAPMSDAVAVGMGGSVYVFGGTDSARLPSLALFVYDIASDTWRSGATMLANTFGSMGAVLGRDGRIYVAGLDWQARRVDAYDPRSDRWSTSPPDLLHPQAYPAMGRIGSRIYAAGGNPGSLTLTSDVMESLRVT